MLNQIVYLIVDRLEYKIVGIVDKNSPSIYAKESEFINIISNSNDNNNQIYGNITIDNSESSITVYIPSSVTSTFDWSIALYDILLISPNQNADIEKIAKGKIFCNKTVTII